jgi:hypothetical protein
MSKPGAAERPLDLGRALLWPGLAVFSFVQVALAASDAAADRIPPLLPPRGEIPPGFWEQHLWHVIAGGMLLLGLLAAAAWWWTRPRAGRPIPAVEHARQELEPLLQEPETGPLLTRVSQVLRGYFAAVLGLPPVEMTTGEFTRELAARDQLEPRLAGAAAEFLRTCDERKFAPAAPSTPFGAVAQALGLIARAEETLAVKSPAGRPVPPGEPMPPRRNDSTPAL